jgi:hypothetical protein
MQRTLLALGILAAAASCLSTPAAAACMVAPSSAGAFQVCLLEPAYTYNASTTHTDFDCGGAPAGSDHGEVSDTRAEPVGVTVPPGLFSGAQQAHHQGDFASQYDCAGPDEQVQAASAAHERADSTFVGVVAVGVFGGDTHVDRSASSSRTTSSTETSDSSSTEDTRIGGVAFGLGIAGQSTSRTREDEHSRTTRDGATERTYELNEQHDHDFTGVDTGTVKAGQERRHDLRDERTTGPDATSIHQERSEKQTGVTVNGFFVGQQEVDHGGCRVVAAGTDVGACAAEVPDVAYRMPDMPDFAVLPSL